VGLRVVVAGQGTMGGAVLRALHGSRHQVVGVVANGRRTRGLWRPLMRLDGLLGAGSPLLVEARRARLPLLWLDRVGEGEVAWLEGLEPDLLLLANFGIILPGRLLGVPRLGTVNTHWSLLPAYRGPAPHTMVILGGESQTGLTFHVVEERIDAGDILDQVAYPVAPDDTAMRLYAKAVRLAEARVLHVLDRVEADGLVGEPQDLAQGSYHRRLRPEDVRIDWGRTAVEIDRLVRACTRPMAWFVHRGRPVWVTRASADPRPVDAPPARVLSARPQVRVATGGGVITIEAAFVRAPLPWVWPAPWSRPGEALDGGVR